MSLSPTLAGTDVVCTLNTNNLSHHDPTVPFNLTTYPQITVLFTLTLRSIRVVQSVDEIVDVMAAVSIASDSVNSPRDIALPLNGPTEGADISELHGTTPADKTAALSAGPHAALVARSALLEGDDGVTINVDAILFA